MVYNEASYDLMVIPGQVKEIDTLEFCELIGIDQSQFIDRINKAKNYSRYKPSVFLKQISKTDFGIIQEKLYKYRGFYAQTRTLRAYQYPIAGHLLGNIGETDRKELEKDPFYKQGDYIGKSGIEKYYEKYLRGNKGMKILEVDVHNRVKGSYQEGRYDTLAVPGKDIVIGLDAELQQYGEQLMVNKKGSIVAIDPKSGEILSIISSPTFDPNELVGRERSKNFVRLLNDTLNPLLDRAIMGQYPPGSTFKMLNALIALQEDVIYPGTKFTCQGEISRPIKCTHSHQSPLELELAIEQSCNPYFWNTFKSILNSSNYGNVKNGYQAWYEHVLSFGLGKTFNTDIPYELSGNIPSGSYYDQVYNGSWNALTVRSLAIGQGEILVTPIQLANLAVTIANKGWYYPPHVAVSVESEPGIATAFDEQIFTTVSPEHFETVINAMTSVFEGEFGTARFYRLDSIAQAGKTGTVQNPHGEDHSMFIAFAPVEDPKIALSVIVENSGYGSRWAAPIASLMIEKYLNRKVKRKSVEKRMVEGDLIAMEKLRQEENDN
jgi:penicillin-binding protein 2